MSRRFYEKETLCYSYFFFFLAFIAYSPAYSQQVSDWRVDNVIISTTEQGPPFQQLQMGQTIWVSATVTNIGTAQGGTKYPSVYLNGQMYWNNVPRTFPGPGQTARVVCFTRTVDQQMVQNNKIKFRFDTGADNNNGNNSAESEYELTIFIKK